MSKDMIKNNDIVVLLSVHKKNRYIVKIEDKSQRIAGLGVYNPIKLVGTKFGDIIPLGTKEFWILKANTLDFLETLKRKAQIIIPKDSALIGLYCNIKPGSRVVEGGLGSGALTIILLTLVGPKGKVISYEIRHEFAKVGTSNIENTEMAHNWKLKNLDITEGITEKNLDAIVLDIPEPWKAVSTSYQALCPGGYIASYLPTMNQVERFVFEISKIPFIEIRSFETLYRDLSLKPGAIRPAFDMLGHTGYITVARKVNEK